MKLQFIPLDYEPFDYNGRNYIKVVGRNEKGKKICIIDSCDVYCWAILKEDAPEKRIKKNHGRNK